VPDCDAWIYGCAYSFYISRNNGSPDFKCQLVDKQTSPAPPAEQSFWAVPCNQGINPSEGWEISVRCYRCFHFCFSSLQQASLAYLFVFTFKHYNEAANTDDVVGV
jgi:hypothetical protein